MDFDNLSFPGAPAILTVPPGPVSRDYLKQQLARESSAVSYPRGLPMALKRARGATLEDVDGNLYIDFFGGAGVMNVGHANPAVVEAALSQLKELSHALDLPNPVRSELVSALARILPEPICKFLFGGPTGSDAVESALKLAKYNKHRPTILAFEGSYHGMTSGALSVTSGLAFKEEFLPLVPEVHFAPYPYCYRCPLGLEIETCALACARYLEHLFEDPHSGVGVPAAVIVEPIQGEGGTIVPPADFLPTVRDICTRYGIVLIADEIQAGFCRTGRMFSFEHSGTVPDVVTMSKALGGIGFPISGIAYRAELDTLPAGKHIGTFRGNLIAFAAGAAALEFMLEQDLANHSLNLGEWMLEQLARIAEGCSSIGDVRGRGLMLGIEFVKDKVSKEPGPDLARVVRRECLERGLVIEIGGHYDNVARFLPPLVLTRELAAKGLAIFADAVRAVEMKRRASPE
jgi:diaminobutyrate-2-oxoglutarate transaminase